ncbi:MAG: hypothetical protein PHV11_06125 [Candidatus Bipolaricaulis sp.]|nr:hypothetical protein [Candidatus Bipolaricaulis sp.]
MTNLPYYLTITFRRSRESRDRTPLAIDANQIDELYITQDINRFLPTLDFTLQDSAGFFTHVVPFDRDLGRLFIEVSGLLGKGRENATVFEFDIYRRKPNSDSQYILNGLLKVDNLFSPSKVRAFSGVIRNSLTSLGEELGANLSEISPSLTAEKILLQANWPNGEFINFLKTNLLGSKGEAGFYSFFKCVESDKVFVFKNLLDMCQENSKYSFILGNTVKQDLQSSEINLPILEYRMFDSGMLLGTTGLLGKDYSYFDYMSGEFIRQSYQMTEEVDGFAFDHFLSLSEYFSIDIEDKAENNISAPYYGRNNDFIAIPKAQAINEHYCKLINLSKIWITTIGVNDLYPGDIVELPMIRSYIGSANNIHTYQGYWLVERVIHILGKVFLTRLLLTRSGINTGSSPTLIRSSRRMRKE